MKTPQPCAMCSSPQQMSHMVEKKNDDGVVELFCNKSCVMASKIQAINASGAGLRQHRHPAGLRQFDRFSLSVCHETSFSHQVFYWIVTTVVR